MRTLFAVVLASSAMGLVRIRPINQDAKPSYLNQVRVATWNIDRGTDLADIVADMKRAPADLLLLQEVDENAARSGHLDIATELARSFDLHGAFATEFEELGQEKAGGHAYIGQATLTRLPLLRTRAIRFQHQSGFWQPRSWMPSNLPLMQRRLGARNALVTELQFRSKLLVVYNLHLESRSYGRIQMDQLDEVLADVQQHYSPGTAVLVGGDLNTKYLPSVFLNKMERMGYRSCLREQIARTHKIAMALDWLFATGPIRLDHGEVRRDLKASDHYPVYAELSY